jgi:subtilase family serine protease
MGLSKGWGDMYPSVIVDQYINVTGLPAGEYTVTATADWANWFVESNESNNSTTAHIHISTAGVTVLDGGVGP